SMETFLPIGTALLGHHDEVTSIAFSPDGRGLASGSLDGTFLLRDAATGAVRNGPVDGLAGPMTDLAFSRRGDVLVVGGPRGTLVFWDATGTRPRMTLHGNGTPKLRLAFSPDGSLVASSHGSMIALWKMKEEPLLGQAASLPLVSVEAAELRQG